MGLYLSFGEELTLWQPREAAAFSCSQRNSWNKPSWAGERQKCPFSSGAGVVAERGKRCSWCSWKEMTLQAGRCSSCWKQPGAGTRLRFRCAQHSKWQPAPQNGACRKTECSLCAGEAFGRECRSLPSAGGGGLVVSPAKSPEGEKIILGDECSCGPWVQKAFGDSLFLEGEGYMHHEEAAVAQQEWRQVF